MNGVTEVRIVYDNTAIYVGAMLYDTAPDSILKELGLRDGADPSSNSGFTDINADLNPMLKLMAEKPLRNFLNTLAGNYKNLNQ